MRIIKWLLASMLIFLGISSLFNSTDVSAKPEFTGEEFYQGIIFGQGNFGERVMSINDEYKNMNSNSNLEFTNEFVNYIQKKDSSYFDNLKEALDNKNAPVALELLQSSGKYFDEYTHTYVTENHVSPASCLILYCAVVVGTVSGYVIQPASGTEINYAAWALKTGDTDNSILVTENPEAELAKIFDAI